MPAVVDRVACPECGAQKGTGCAEPIWTMTGEFIGIGPVCTEPHQARFEALWALNRRLETANVNDRSTP